MNPRAEIIEAALARAVDGDADALAVLWSEHQSRLLRYVRGRGIADAEDVVTQVWIDAARGLGRFQGGADDFRRGCSRSPITAWSTSVADGRAGGRHPCRRRSPAPAPTPISSNVMPSIER